MLELVSFKGNNKSPKSQVIKHVAVVLDLAFRNIEQYCTQLLTK